VEASDLDRLTSQMMEPKKKPIPNPARLLATGFLVAIAFGTLLLSLPVATADGRGLPLIDAFFMATSATCVTGLVVVDVGTTLSHFGQLVILTLFQIGGIGIMTVTTLFAFALGRHISLSDTLTVGEALGNPRLSGILLLARNVALLTLAVEVIGALLLTGIWSAEYPFGQALYYGVFHSVSAFCNAGFDLFGQSLAGYTTNVPVNLVFLSLIIIGGLGFQVTSELMAAKRNRSGGGRLSLHTRVVLKTTGLLIAVGTILVFVFEYANPATLGPLPLGNKLLAALFQAVTPRTAGFNTISTAGLLPPTLLVVIGLMFIGASPGSTGGGIKTTTFACVFFSIRSALRRREDVESGGRRLPQEVAVKAWIIAAMALGLIFIAAVVLLATEDAPAISILFETFSAFGTVGLSMGLTPDLSLFGRILLPCLMYVGRVGLLTLVVALARKRMGTGDWHLPEERIYVG
jgi:trk system potassium uptake protein TrkH